MTEAEKLEKKARKEKNKVKSKKYKTDYEALLIELQSDYDNLIGAGQEETSNALLDVIANVKTQIDSLTQPDE